MHQGQSTDFHRATEHRAEPQTAAPRTAATGTARGAPSTQASICGMGAHPCTWLSQDAELGI